MSRFLPIDVTLVTAPGCHFCEDAAQLLEEFRQSARLVIREVGLTSEEGRELAIRYRVPFPPILVIDGVYFGHGRISRRKLERRLDELSQVEAAVE